ncbi:papain family cysteine protease domain-containing protein [Ditylenchus destructor]|nr:papain family cysteine protease domain-containing protein [Ditylenchus destructor]
MNDDEKRTQAKKQVEEINKKNNGRWRAEFNERFALLELEHKKRMAGTISRKSRDDTKNSTPSVNSQQPNAHFGVPSIFDSRTKWSQCAPFMNNIRDQSNCGDCWAVSSGSVLTDRRCIARAKQEADVMTCSKGAPDGNGCDGGYVDKAFAYMVSKGVLTGTNYTWGAGCKPYPFPETGGPYHAGNCSSTCSTSSNDYSRTKMINYTALYDGSSTYEQQMMQEIYNNGPVVAVMVVYEDLYYYSSGVYAHTNGSNLGSHAVRVMGWGNLNGVDYWLVANSWGTSWGQNGWFYIERGVNEVGIESEITYGTVQ